MAKRQRVTFGGSGKRVSFMVNIKTRSETEIRERIQKRENDIRKAILERRLDNAIGLQLLNEELYWMLYEDKRTKKKPRRRTSHEHYRIGYNCCGGGRFQREALERAKLYGKYGPDVRIRKVRILGGRLREQADKAGYAPNDLVIVTTIIKPHSLPIYKLEKIVGSPIEYLLRRCGK